MRRNVTKERGRRGGGNVLSLLPRAKKSEKPSTVWRERVVGEGTTFPVYSKPPRFSAMDKEAKEKKRRKEMQVVLSLQEREK